jgi:hypothetical protein
MDAARNFIRSGAVMLCCAALALSGCSARKRPGIVWAAAVQVKPVLQTHNAAASALTDDPGPELVLELPPFPSHLMTVRSGPPRPRASTPASAAAGGEAGKLENPMIAPQLSAQESAVAQQQTNQSLGIAEKNLGAARGKNLNAAQVDLVSKIRGFMKDAREAAQITDWEHARSLAKKAQVLSEELAASL